MDKVLLLVLSCILACNSMNAMDHGNSLIYATITDDLELASTLLKSRADVNWQDPKFGHSALHFVKNIAMAKLLLDHGANINLPAKNGITALDCIIHKELGEDIDLLKFLLSRGAHVNPQDHASLLQWPHVLKKNVIKLSFKNGEVVHSSDLSGSEPLQMTLPMAYRQRKIANLLRSWAVVATGSKAGRLAFLMAQDGHAGKDSPANLLSQYLFQEICSYLRPSVLFDDPQVVADYNRQTQSWVYHKLMRTRSYFKGFI